MLQQQEANLEERGLTVQVHESHRTTTTAHLPVASRDHTTGPYPYLLLLLLLLYFDGLPEPLLYNSLRGDPLTLNGPPPPTGAVVLDALPLLLLPLLVVILPVLARCELLALLLPVEEIIVPRPEQLSHRGER